MPSNTNFAINLACIAIGMLALAYASVPLYRLFCATTGYGGTTREGIYTPGKAIDRSITIAFNADTDPALPWEFKPGEHSTTVRIGKQAFTHYTARNMSEKPITGRAVYNVVPFAAGPYFVKVECFCFKEQTLQPGQKVNMPVLFYLDPAIADDPNLKGLKNITLSYTFFEVKK